MYSRGHMYRSIKKKKMLSTDVTELQTFIFQWLNRMSPTVVSLTSKHTYQNHLNTQQNYMNLIRVCVVRDLWNFTDVHNKFCYTHETQMLSLLNLQFFSFLFFPFDERNWSPEQTDALCSFTLPHSQERLQRLKQTLVPARFTQALVKGQAPFEDLFCLVQCHALVFFF